MPEFVLYYRENCHLCESMRLALHRLRRSIDIGWREVDIDRDTDLIRRFDVLVPALYLGEREICHHFLDEAAVRREVEGG